MTDHEVPSQLHHIYDHDRRFNGSAPGRRAVCGARMPEQDPISQLQVCPECTAIRNADRSTH